MKLGILGATGAVGREMLNVIEERKIKVDELKLLASEKSSGKTLKYNGCDVKVEATNEDSFKGLDVVLGAVENEFAKKYAKSIVDSGAVFIDNSSAFRLDSDVPLIVPEINKSDIKNHKGIIANPNCSTIITLMAVAPINKLSEIKYMIASTYQAVSGAGVKGINDLNEQMLILSKEYEKDKNDVSINRGVLKNDMVSTAFKYQIGANVIPAIGNATDNLYTKEEMKMQNEGRKIMHLPNLKVTCTCVRVPVMRSHSISVSVFTKDKLNILDVRKSIENFEGVKLVDDIENNIYPMPLRTCDKDYVEVGRIREDLTFDNGIALFCSGDQVRKGAATNAVEILENL